MTDAKSPQEYRTGDFNSEAWVFDHVVCGLMCGYSECCIKYSLLRRHSDAPPEHPLRDTGVILCPHCAESLDAAYERIRAARMIAVPFPYDGILSDDVFSDVTPSQEAKDKALRIHSELGKWDGLPPLSASMCQD